jgi:CspA family cold shock protein
VEDNGRVLGTVQWFSRVKGYGFVRPDGDEEDVFIHYSLIQGEGYRNLARGQRVEFTMEDTPKGPQAAELIGLEMESDQDEGADEVELETDLQQDVEASVIELGTDFQHDVEGAEL